MLQPEPLRQPLLDVPKRDGTRRDFEAPHDGQVTSEVRAAVRTSFSKRRPQLSHMYSYMGMSTSAHGARTIDTA